MIAIARHGGGCLLVSWLIGVSSAWSGEEDAAATSALQEVVVTAQRSKSALQTTPLAVTALSGPALKALLSGIEPRSARFFISRRPWA
jgi:hypothetical protein